MVKRKEEKEGRRKEDCMDKYDAEVFANIQGTIKESTVWIQNAAFK